METTRTEAVRAFDATVALAEAVRGYGTVPAGKLYALVMNKLSLQAFDGAIALLGRAGIVRRDASHLLTWTGPNLEEGDPTSARPCGHVAGTPAGCTACEFLAGEESSLEARS